MAKLPDLVSKAWQEKQDAIVFTTVDQQGVPNSIWATCVSQYDDETIVIANNYFDKTLKNINAGTKASVLFITKDGKAYQIKGTIENHTSGLVFDDMKTWNPKKHPGHAAVAVKVEQVTLAQKS